MNITNIIEECNIYYSINISELRNCLTASFLCNIANAKERETLIHPTNNNITYTQGNSYLCYKVMFKEFSNYNLSVLLHIQPQTNKIIELSLHIKTYTIIFSRALGNIVMRRHDSSYRGLPQSFLVSRSIIAKLAKDADCPQLNPFIIPFFYIKKFNELDSFVSSLTCTKRRTKHR